MICVTAWLSAESAVKLFSFLPVICGEAFLDDRSELNFPNTPHWLLICHLLPHLPAQSEDSGWEEEHAH